MAWLPLYLYDRDPEIVLETLNSDPEIAFLIADAPGRWKAVPTLGSFPVGRYSIWHIPSGPLPLLHVNWELDSWIKDPWSGWTEQRRGADPSKPYFGPSPPGVISLHLRCQAGWRGGRVGISSFEWVGRSKTIIGHIPAPETEIWWKRLRQTFRKIGTLVPRSGPDGSGKPEIVALPGAMEAFNAGVVITQYSY